MYEKVADLVYKGIAYPGYKISYKSNIGTSPAGQNHTFF
jgi:hypothetical protein